MNDFIKDLKFNDERDNEDRPFNGLIAPIEFSECNRNYLLEAFNKIKDSAKSILEIGVCRNGNNSSSYVFLNNKKHETVYVGVDLEDKSFLDNAEKNTYTLQCNSSNYQHIIDYCLKLGIFEFDFIFIDGYHSVNQCIDDWKFVSKLSKNGIVGLHDTSNHPGPVAIIDNINRDLWNVERYCLDDNGISFLTKK